MKSCSRSAKLLLWFAYMMIPVLEAQKLKFWTEVTGYLGHEVTLPCQFIPGLQTTNPTQVMWELEPPGGEKILLIVFNFQLGVSVQDTYLKDRVEIAEQTNLKIKDVEMEDAGKYTCIVATFPSGVFEGITNLVVQEEMGQQILPRMIATGVFMLIVVTMLATTYFIIIRIRRGASVRHRVYTDAEGPVVWD